MTQQKRGGWCAAIVGLALWSQAATAGFEMGNDLYAKCPAQRPDSIREAAALGHVIGGHDTATGDTAKPATYCRPTGVSAVQMRDVVCAWLTNHPENRHYTANSIIVVALTQAWPCTR